MASCGTPGRGNLFSSDTAKIEVFGVEERWVETAVLCRTEPYYVILPEERSHRGARAACSLLNATLAIPGSSRDNQLLTEQLLPFRNTCTPTALWKLWLGVDIREVGDVLTETITGKPLSYTNFSPTTKARGSVLRCATLRLDGFWQKDYCHETVKRCAACSFQSTDFLRLRGLCFDNEMQTRFRVQASQSGRPFFRGYYGLLITWVVETSRWQLVDPATNATLMWAVGVGNNAYPIGRREWKLLKETCEITADQTISLSLSVCGQEHFMCDSGECVAYDRRCNYRNDCQDQSDEMNCNVVDNGDEFQRQMPPTGAQGGVLTLITSLSLSRIASVDDRNMAVNLEFQFTLTWTDDRLRLKHLRESKNGTILTDDEARKVWRPVYHIMNLDGGHMKLLGQSFLVKTAKNAIPPSFNDVNMDVIYPGSANELSFTQRYSVRVTCNFQLYAYPFDVQLCKIDLRLPLEYDGYVQFAAAEEATISYTGPQNLAMYTIRNLWTASSEFDRFVVQFELHRRQGVILLSTFVPSGLLLLVSWSTLFVKLEALNVRAIMSLTTLLVLYTLFANMSSSLPTTASIKLIDVWFFFIIFLLFVNIVIHIFVDRKPLRKDERKKIFVQEGHHTQPHGSNPSPDLLSTNLRFLNYYRYIILPVLIVLFNVAFWSAVFAQ
ncbi:glutamate-gated chloride channel alpha-like [Panulirus ornatus]|uniref:glutamate-gated chloride channel alpha-like n=1 Tax=Panulirus ornatus TaxID=150431 RepID=UPI003A849DA2